VGGAGGGAVGGAAGGAAEGAEDHRQDGRKCRSKPGMVAVSPCATYKLFIFLCVFLDASCKFLGIAYFTIPGISPF
jgi:hypothetical protein